MGLIFHADHDAGSDGMIAGCAVSAHNLPPVCRCSGRCLLVLSSAESLLLRQVSVPCKLPFFTSVAGHLAERNFHRLMENDAKYLPLGYGELDILPSFLIQKAEMDQTSADMFH